MAESISYSSRIVIDVAKAWGESRVDMDNQYDLPSPGLGVHELFTEIADMTNRAAVNTKFDTDNQEESARDWLKRLASLAGFADDQSGIVKVEAGSVASKPGEHAFFITFTPTLNGVELSEPKRVFAAVSTIDSGDEMGPYTGDVTLARVSEESGGHFVYLNGHTHSYLGTAKLVREFAFSSEGNLSKTKGISRIGDAIQQQFTALHISQ